jgi:hypothetical protein
MEVGEEGGVAVDGYAKRLGDGLAGEVVFGGPETAHDGKNVGAAEGGADGADEILEAVADDGLEGHGDADLVEFFGEIERIRILPDGGKHFRTDGDYL